MTKFKYHLVAMLFIFSMVAPAQEDGVKQREGGHVNQSLFKQLKEEFATPNTYRSASGAPGPDYYQQQANYVMDIELDDKNRRIYGEETITYINNSPDHLDYLWLQLDQNYRAKDSKAKLKNGSGVPLAEPTSAFYGKYMAEPFEGGFNIEHVKDASGSPLPYTINFTMMRIDLPVPLKSGEQVSFSINEVFSLSTHIATYNISKFWLTQK